MIKMEIFLPKQLCNNKNNWVLINDWVYVDNDFKADLGFVPRTDILKWEILHSVFSQKQ